MREWYKAKTFVLVTKEKCVGDNGKKSKSTSDIPTKVGLRKVDGFRTNMMYEKAFYCGGGGGHLNTGI